MNLKFRLASLYSLSVVIILLASSVLIYALNENFRKEEFIKRLVLTVTEANRLFFSPQQSTADIHPEVSMSVMHKLPLEHISIYDSSLKLHYSTLGKSGIVLNNNLLKLATHNELYTFSQKEREAALLHRVHKGKSYYILASATDIFGRRKSENLRIVLTSSVIVGFILSAFLAFFYVRQMMKPIEQLKTQIEAINERNLKQRLPAVKDSNEVSQLAIKFNAMLDRLEQAFEQRKSFVQHASHELRTPLANMLAQTEVALNKPLSPLEYRSVLFSLKEDQQDLIDLTNSLLTLSRYENIRSLQDWIKIRIDEALYEAIDMVNEVWPMASVSVDFETLPENENDLVIEGNESLVKSAVLNLLKNAIQYSSDGKAKVVISITADGIALKFDNNGKQLSPEEQRKMFIPFFRGENSQHKKGFGIGLSIVQRIINVHNGTLLYEAINHNTNRFVVFFPSSLKKA